MKDDSTTNAHYTSPMHFSLKGWENVLFELGSERENTKTVKLLNIGNLSEKSLLTGATLPNAHAEGSTAE